MPRQKAILQGRSSQRELSIHEAISLVALGKAVDISFNPRIIRFRNYEEEQRYLAGRKVPRATRQGFIVGPRGKSRPTHPNAFRCKAPRQELDEEEKKYRRYRNRYFRKRGEEDQVRAEMRQSA